MFHLCVDTYLCITKTYLYKIEHNNDFYGELAVKR